jgi:hypothetical protein
MQEQKFETVGNTVLIHHVYCRYDIKNGWLWQRMHTLSCAVYGRANPSVSSYMPLGLGLTMKWPITFGTVCHCCLLLDSLCILYILVHTIKKNRYIAHVVQIDTLRIQNKLKINIFLFMQKRE